MKFSTIALIAGIFLTQGALSDSLPGQTLQGFSGDDCTGNAGNIDNCDDGTRCIEWTGRVSADLKDTTTGGLANVFVKVFKEAGCTGSNVIQQLGGLLTTSLWMVERFTPARRLLTWGLVAASQVLIARAYPQVHRSSAVGKAFVKAVFDSDGWRFSDRS